MLDDFDIRTLKRVKKVLESVYEREGRESQNIAIKDLKRIIEKLESKK